MPDRCSDGLNQVAGGTLRVAAADGDTVMEITQNPLIGTSSSSRGGYSIPIPAPRYSGM